MYLSLNWLKEFVKFKQTPEQVAEILTSGGFEVEKIERWGTGLEKVIVGQIKTIINHAEADRLSVCKVDVGKKQLLNIVCGARNIKPGQKVPVALIGATLPSGLTIEERRIRGIVSAGMLCAEDELGLGMDHKGIFILAKDAPLGRPLGQAIGLTDTVLDVTVLANRPDCLSIIGLAREFAALQGQKFTEKKAALNESKKYSIKQSISVQVADHDLCPKYTARVVKNVKIKSSPEWLRSRLTVSGIKPINTVVDVTNYVMLEMGQPLHAFDLARVKGKKILVRPAGPDQAFTTLDGEQRKLSSDTLVIADAKEPIAIAGVMGGAHSEITRETKDVVIESAIFKPISVRKTKQALGLPTEASVRFEKGIWWGLPEQAADRAAQLMSEIAGGDIAKGMIMVSKVKEKKPAVVTVELAYINKLMGHDFTAAEVKNILERLSFRVTESKGMFKVTAPAWRQDVSLPADIVEEVGRVYGWNSLRPAPVYGEFRPMILPSEKYWERKVKDTLVACGLTEVLNYSFYGQSLLEQFGYQTKDHYRVENPLNPEQEYMRISLLPRMYENLLKNYQSREAVKLFEVGRVFIKTNKEMPDERIRLAGIVYTKEKRRDLSSERVNILEKLFQELGIVSDEIQYVEKNDGLIQSSIMIGNESIGYMGSIPFNAQKFGNVPMWFEINIDKLVKSAVMQKKYKPLSEFPSVERDMTFTTTPQTGSNVDYHLIVSTVKRLSPLIEQAMAIVNIHTESDGQKSISFRIEYQDESKTLTSQDVDIVENKIIQVMQTNPFNFILKSHKLV